jgi:hypothetical protein
MRRGCVRIAGRNWLTRCFYTQLCQLGLQESCGRPLISKLTAATIPTFSLFSVTRMNWRKRQQKPEDRVYLRDSQGRSQTTRSSAFISLMKNP